MQVGHVDVQALRLQVGADEAVGREVGRDGDRQHLLGEDVVERGLRESRCGERQARGGGAEAQGSAEDRCNHVEGRQAM